MAVFTIKDGKKKGGRKEGVQRGVDGESSYEYLLRRGWYWQGVRTGKNKLQIESDQKELETEKRSNPKLKSTVCEKWQVINPLAL